VKLTRRDFVLAGVAGAALGGAGVARLLEHDDPPPPRPACPPRPEPSVRPAPNRRLEAADTGVVLRHGDGPGGCDAVGARDVVAWRYEDRWYMHYDGGRATGWPLCLATSDDGRVWTKHGPVLELGPPGSPDAGSASYGIPVPTPQGWHLFYLGAGSNTGPPEGVPAAPYVTLKAHGPGPMGPWEKQPGVIPFAPQPGTYYAYGASPGAVISVGDEYSQFFAAAAGDPLQRTVGRARTRDLDGPWTVDPQPVLPIGEQVENSALYFEQDNDTWFLFTNHVAAAEVEYTDAIWVYWTKDLEHWDPQNKAVVLDNHNCCWSQRVIGLPSIVPVEDRIALFYDGLQGASTSHVGRDVGLAWLPRPLAPPRE